MGFNSGFTAIRTIEGDKYIKDIVVGMSVMSYKESYHIAKKLVQELATKYDVSYNIRCEDDIVLIAVKPELNPIIIPPLYIPRKGR